MLKALAVAPEQIWTGVPDVFHYGQYSVGWVCSFFLLLFFFFFFLLVIFPPFLPSLCHSLTSREIKYTKSLSEKSSTPDHVCQWTIDKGTPKLFFLHIFHVSHISSLLSSLSHPPLPSPLSKNKKKEKTHKNKRHNRPQPPPLTNPSHRNRTNRRLKNQLKFTKQYRRNSPHSIR